MDIKFKKQGFVGAYKLNFRGCKYIILKVNNFKPKRYTIHSKSHHHYSIHVECVNIRKLLLAGRQVRDGVMHLLLYWSIKYTNKMVNYHLYLNDKAVTLHPIVNVTLYPSLYLTIILTSSGSS